MPVLPIGFLVRIVQLLPCGRNIVQFGTSLGRGKFNPAYPTPPQQTTLALATEPFGRDNFNVFDLLFTHVFSSVLSYNLEIM